MLHDDGKLDGYIYFPLDIIQEPILYTQKKYPDQFNFM